MDDTKILIRYSCYHLLNESLSCFFYSAFFVHFKLNDLLSKIITVFNADFNVNLSGGTCLSHELNDYKANVLFIKHWSLQ